MTDPASIHDPATLTRHLEAHHHARYRARLPSLLELSEKVERVHADDPRAPAGLADVLLGMIGVLDGHMKVAEAVLFPAIRAGETGSIASHVAAMRADHAALADDLTEMRRITDGPSLADDACGSWRRLHAGVETFAADLAEHLRLKRERLLPLLEERLQAEPAS